MRLIIGQHLLRLIPPMFLAVFALSSSGQGPPCDSLEPIPESPMQYKNRGNRCEGFYVADVGARNIDVVALTIGPLKYDLSKDAKLLISAPAQIGLVHVRAVAIPPRTYYRMDADLNGGKVLEWPVDEVLRPAKLISERIGILAWRSLGKEKVLVPLLIRTSGSSTESRPTPIYLVVRPSFDVEAVKWRFGSAGEAGCSPLGPWRDAPRTEALAGQPISIKLAGFKGLMCVEVAARTENSDDWATLPLRLELPSQ
jgi:hypothetical protein